MCSLRQQHSDIAPNRSGKAIVVGALVLLLALIQTFAGDSDSVYAHAAYDRSEPAANAIVPTAPSQIRIWFTEPLEESRSGARVYDREGVELAGVSSVVDPNNDFALIVSLPAGLANGTYTVAWHNVSTADGHPKDGFFAFTIGTAADVGAAVAVESDLGGPPDWLKTVSRWIALVGLAAAVAIWPVWLFVLRPALVSLGETGERAAVRAQWLAIWALLAALAGNILALLVQAASGTDEGLLDATWSTLSDTRYGRLWLMRIVLLAALATVLSWASWWPRRWHDPLGLVALVIAALLPIPYSMISHAAAQTTGRATAIAFDVVHLLSSSIWVGGLFALGAILLPAVRSVGPGERRPILATAVPRFSALALTAWVALLVTGLYAAWLQVGSWEALTETAYGTSLVVKLIVLLPLLVLGAINLLVVGPTARREPPPDSARVGRLSRRFVLAVSAEVVLVTLLLLAVGRLTSQEPAREELASAQPDGLTIPFELAASSGPVTGNLTVTPGVPGPNEYRLEVDGEPLPDGTEAVVRLTLPGVDIGLKELRLTREGENAFVGNGSELAIAGTWDVEVVVRRVGAFQGTGTLSVPIGDEALAQTDRASSVWRFEWPAIAGLLFAIVGSGALLATWAIGNNPRRFQTVLGGGAAIFVGLILFVGARIPATEVTLGHGPTAGLLVVGMGTPAAVGDLTVTLTPTTFVYGRNDVVISVADQSGAPVSDATVNLEAHMMEMAMDVPSMQATPTDPGRYVATSVPLDMNGPWQFLVTVSRPGAEDVTVAFDVTVY